VAETTYHPPALQGAARYAGPDSVRPRQGDPVQPPDGDAADAPTTAYLVLTLKLSEEAAQVPVIEVIRAVRTAAVSLAASYGEQPALEEVEEAARKRLGIAG